MRLHDWLREKKGRASALAKRFGVTRAAVTQWRANGAPPPYIRAISAETAGEVSVTDLLLDIERRREEAV